MKISTLQKGLIGHWLLDYNHGLKDQTPYGNDIAWGTGNTILGQATDQHGRIKGATAFSGSNQALSIADNDLLTPANITVACWVKSTAVTNEQILAIKLGPAATYLGWDLELYQSKVTFAINTNYFRQASTVLSKDTWYHIAVTYTGARIEFYHNGAADGGFPALQGISANNVALQFASLSGQYSLTGSMNDFRIYNRVLTATEITQLYNMHIPKLKLGSNISEGWIDGKAGTVLEGKYVYYKDATATSTWALRESQKNPAGRIATLTELQAIYTDKALYGTFVGNYYWSSTEYDPTKAYTIHFGNSNTYITTKTTPCYVRYIADSKSTEWIAGKVGTVLEGKWVSKNNLPSAKYKTTNDNVTAPQGAINLDPNYMAQFSLVADNSVDFSSYPARQACKIVGGRLPLTTELQAMYADQEYYGNNFLNTYFWSATQWGEFYAWFVDFYSGGAITATSKTGSYSVRAVADTLPSRNLKVRTDGSAGAVMSLPMKENTGTVTYDKIGTNNGTFGAVELAPTWTKDKGNVCLAFNGNHLIIPNGILNLANAYTVNIWAKITDFEPNAGNNRRIFTLTGSDASQLEFCCYTGARMSFRKTTGTAGSYVTQVASPFTVSTWYMITVTYTGSAYALYINGVSKTIDAGGITAAGSTSYIGSNGAAGYMIGLADEFRLYNVVLTQNQITALYNAQKLAHN